MWFTKGFCNQTVYTFRHNKSLADTNITIQMQQIKLKRRTLFCLHCPVSNNLNCHCLQYHSNTHRKLKHKQLLLTKSSFERECNMQQKSEWQNDMQLNISEMSRMPKRSTKQHRQTWRESTANYLHRFDHNYWTNALQNQRRQRAFLCRLENKIPFQTL